MQYLIRLINYYLRVMTKKITISIISAVVVVLGISSLVWANKKGATSTTQASQKVTIAMVTFPGYAPLYLAKEKGFFGNVDVDLQRIEAIGDIRAAVRSGNVQIYAATHDIYQSTKDVPPTGVGFLAIDESRGGDGVATTNSIQSIADLRGKKVGAEPGFPPYMVLQYMLDKEGMTLNDVDFQDMSTTDAGNAFSAGQLDAAGIYEPALSASVNARPNSKVLVSSADLPGLIQDFLFADETYAKEHLEVLQQVAEGYFKALDYINTNPDESYDIMAKAFDVSKQDMQDFKTGITWTTKAENKQLFDATNSANAYATFTLVGDILQKNGEATVRVPANEKLTSTIINSIK